MHQLLAYKGLFVAAVLVAFFIAERLAPVAPPKGRGRLASNGGLWLVQAGAYPLTVLPLTLLAAEHAIDWRPDWSRGGTGLALDLLILDFWIYWQHRANHALPFLWRFHSVHHLDETLDATSAVRFHVGEVLISALARAAIVFVFAIPFLSVVVFETLVLAISIFHHSNARLGVFDRGLRPLLVTPSHHWVHHHQGPDTNSNYATLLRGWDVLFGTCSATQRAPDMPIGLEGARDPGFLSLLATPFKTQDRTQSRANRQ